MIYAQKIPFSVLDFWYPIVVEFYFTTLQVIAPVNQIFVLDSDAIADIALGADIENIQELVATVELLFQVKPETNSVAAIEAQICLIGLIGEMDVAFRGREGVETIRVCSGVVKVVV